MTLALDTISGAMSIDKSLLLISGDRPRADFVEWVRKSVGADRVRVLSEIRRSLPSNRPLVADVVVVMKDTIPHAVHGQVNRAYANCKLVPLVRKKAQAERILRQAGFKPIAWFQDNGQVPAVAPVAKEPEVAISGNPIADVSRAVHGASLEDIVWLRQHPQFVAIRGLTWLSISTIRLPEKGRFRSDRELLDAATAYERRFTSTERPERTRRFRVVAALAEKFKALQRTPSRRTATWVIWHTTKSDPALMEGCEGVILEAVVLSGLSFAFESARGAWFSSWPVVLRSVIRSVDAAYDKASAPAPEAALAVVEAPKEVSRAEAPTPPSGRRILAAFRQAFAGPIWFDALAWVRGHADFHALRAIPWQEIVDAKLDAHGKVQGRRAALLKAASEVEALFPTVESAQTTRRFEIVDRLTARLLHDRRTPSRAQASKAVSDLKFGHDKCTEPIDGVFLEALARTGLGARLDNPKVTVPWIQVLREAIAAKVPVEGASTMPSGASQAKAVPMVAEEEKDEYTERAHRSKHPVVGSLFRQLPSLTVADLAWLRQQPELRVLRRTSWKELVLAFDKARVRGARRSASDEGLLQAAYACFHDETVAEDPDLGWRFRAVRVLADRMARDGGASTPTTANMLVRRHAGPMGKLAVLSGIIHEAMALAELSWMGVGRSKLPLTEVLRDVLRDTRAVGEIKSAVAPTEPKKGPAMLDQVVPPVLSSEPLTRLDAGGSRAPEPATIAWDVPGQLVQPLQALKAAMLLHGISEALVKSDGACELTPVSKIKVHV